MMLECIYIYIKLINENYLFKCKIPSEIIKCTQTLERIYIICWIYQLLCISFMLKSIKGFNVRACRYQYLNTASCDINVIHKFI